MLQCSMIRILLFVLGLVLGSGAFAADLTSSFYKTLNNQQLLSPQEQAVLSNYNIYLVPGILSETFVDGDDRSSITFSRLTGEYFEGPLHLDKWLKPIIPYFNTSPETIRYLGTASRKKFMTENHKIIQELTQRISIITVGGVVNGHSSLFTPAVSIIATGCFKVVLGQCVIRTSFKGPYDSSDGMVPFESSKIEGADFIKIEGVDHGETVVNIPFQQHDKDQLTTALLKTLLPKLAR